MLPEGWTRRALTVVNGMLLLLLLAGPRALPAQISPGKLARAHQSLEGTTQCVKCHAINRAPMAKACLSCHTDVQALVTQRRGYHARLTSAQRGNCASCHPDHAGLDFDMVDWGSGGKTGFDHRQAGWALEGKHIKTKCEDCHTTSYRKDPVVSLSKRKTGTPWIGLSPTCASCHQADDIHQGALKGGCESCHDAKAWDPAPKFDHAESRYPLTGKHADAKCASCHESTKLPLRKDKEGAVIALYRPVPFAKCNDCHTDPHKGRIRESCSSCHDTRAWDAVEKRGFDHAATRYPLKGKHARVSCAACHGPNNEKPTPAYGTCASCHTDVHRAEARGRGDCTACHGMEGFAPSSFTLTAHAATAYPLEGKHRATPCAACHTTKVTPGTPTARATTSAATRYVRLRMPAANCTDCHADVHGGQPAVKAANTTCVTCHSVEGFKPSSIGVAAHATLRFPLEGAHQRATCAACHGTARAGIPAPLTPAGTAGFVFALRDTACVSCHVDPHGGRYAAKGARATLGCASCHTASRFRPSVIAANTHDRFGFRIDGAHQAVACADCHREMSTPPLRSSLRLPAVMTSTLPFAEHTVRSCQSCHTDVHGGQFAKRRDKGTCESCHTTDHFVGAARFNHERQTTFPLAGAHSTVSCARCHGVMPNAVAEAPPTARRQYAGISTACESCHTTKSTRTRE